MQGERERCRPTAPYDEMCLKVKALSKSVLDRDPRKVCAKSSCPLSGDGFGKTQEHNFELCVASTKLCLGRR